MELSRRNVRRWESNFSKQSYLRKSVCMKWSEGFPRRLRPCVGIDGAVIRHHQWFAARCEPGNLNTIFDTVFPLFFSIPTPRSMGFLNYVFSSLNSNDKIVNLCVYNEIFNDKNYCGQWKTFFSWIRVFFRFFSDCFLTLGDEKCGQHVVEQHCRTNAVSRQIHGPIYRAKNFSYLVIGDDRKKNDGKKFNGFDKTLFGQTINGRELYNIFGILSTLLTTFSPSRNEPSDYVFSLSIVIVCTKFLIVRDRFKKSQSLFRFDASSRIIET